MRPVHCYTCNRTMPLSIAENPNLHPCAKEPPMTTSDPTPSDHDERVESIARELERDGQYHAADTLRAEQRARQAAEAKAEIAELTYQTIVEQYGPKRDVAKRMTEQRDSLQQRIDAALDLCRGSGEVPRRIALIVSALTARTESKEPDHG